MIAAFLCALALGAEPPPRAAPPEAPARGRAEELPPLSPEDVAVVEHLELLERLELLEDLPVVDVGEEDEE